MSYKVKPLKLPETLMGTLDDFWEHWKLGKQYYYEYTLFL